MTRSRGSRFGWLVAVLLAGSVLAGGCAGSGYHYVKNSDDHAYFKVPDDWKLYDEDAVIKVFGRGLSPREKRAQRDSGWQVGFDASPKPTLRHLGDPTSRYPVGIAIVRELAFEDSDTVSLQGLRNLFFDVDGALQSEAGEIIEYEPVELDGGFRGIHIVVELDSIDGRVLTMNQTSVVDQATSKVYTLLVTCEAQCYEDDQDQIDRVVESWTVKD